MNGRFTALLALALALGGCGAAHGPDVAPCTPPGAGRPLGPTAEAQAWLDAHNLVRAGCAVPLSPAPAPPLPALAWSAAAAAVAQAWADGCAWGHNPGRGADGTPRGENVAASTPGAWPERAGVVDAWASEWSDYAFAAGACAPGRTCGHYTQLVWRGTLRVGCGRATCTTGSPIPASPTWDYYVCDYEPPGNLPGQPPY